MMQEQHCSTTRHPRTFWTEQMITYNLDKVDALPADQLSFATTELEAIDYEFYLRVLLSYPRIGPAPRPSHTQLPADFQPPPQRLAREDGNFEQGFDQSVLAEASQRRPSGNFRPYDALTLSARRGARVRGEFVL